MWTYIRRVGVSVLLWYSIAFAGNGVVGTHVSAEPQGNAEVVCTTTHISAVVDVVGGGLFETHTVIPYGMCPGHFDLSPGEARILIEAPLILQHGYEQFLKGIDFGSKKSLITIGVKGNWMVPDINREAALKVSEILSGILPEHSDTFHATARKYRAETAALGDSLRGLLSAYQDIPVICATMNRDFLEWTGLHVLSDYPRDEDMSIQMMQSVIVEGRKKGVKCVIDNKQSSGKVGQTIAGNLGVPFVVLTNFPDTETGAGNAYFAAFRDNCALCLDALEKTGQ